VRTAALFLLLVACGADPEIERLVAALEAGDKQGRALAKIGPDMRDDLDPVFDLMERDDRRFVQTTCLEALLSAGAGTDALPAVERAIEHRDRSVSDLAALIHWRITQTPEPGLALLLTRATALPTDRFALAALRRAAPIPTSVVADTVARLGAESPMSMAGLQTLAAFGPAARTALPAIEASFVSKSAGTRIAAAEAYARVSGDLRGAMDRLVVDFRPDNLFLRQRIVGVWGQLSTERPDEMAREFIRLTGDESAAVRELAAVLLGEMKAGDAEAALTKLAENDPADMVRRAAAHALKKRGE